MLRCFRDALFSKGKTNVILVLTLDIILNTKTSINKLTVIHLSYISNGAVGFGERERTTIFQEALRRLLCDERNGVGLSP